MVKSELTKDLEKHIRKTAGLKRPKTTANAIYFIFKQNAVSIDDRKIYSKTLKGIKEYLSVDFGWSMVEIHACFCELNNLLKY